MVRDCALSHKIDYNNKFKETLNIKGHKVNLAERADFAYWWSCIVKGLRLQPAQLYLYGR